MRELAGPETGCYRTREGAPARHKSQERARYSTQSQVQGRQQIQICKEQQVSQNC